MSPIPHALRGTLALLLLFVTAQPARAQFAQYTTPGGGSEDPRTRKEALDDAIANARWKLGALRLDPWFGLRDLGYLGDAERRDADETTEERDAQLTATVGAGLRAYLPVGSRVVLAAHALPEYIWAEDPDLRRSNGRFGIGAFAFWNRLTFEVTAARRQELAIATSELLRRTDLRTEELGAAVDLNLRGSLYLFARATETTIENRVDEEDDAELGALSALDREERVERVGLRLKGRGGWALGVGVETSEVDFQQGALDLSHRGESPVLEVRRRSPRSSLSVDLVARSLTPRGAARFTPFDGLTGSAVVALGLDRRFQPGLSLRRGLLYSLEGSGTYAESDRLAATLKVRLGHRASVTALIESGRDDYLPSPGSPDREDESLAFGASFEMRLLRSSHLVVGALREEYDSTVDANDRALTTIRAGITLKAGSSGWY